MRSSSGPAPWLLLTTTAAVLCLSPEAALAQARLRGQGSGSSYLRRVAVKAETDIVGPFATTRLEITYHNSYYGRMEADFEYTLPPNTLASGFAYWFQNEKVTARVVEKERAAEIYRHITSRQRDPALIERVNDRTFRARIFPVEADADLRVEMIFRQVLASDAGGLVYELPLLGSESEIVDGEALEKIDLRVRVRPGFPGAGIRNNLGLPVEAFEHGTRLVLSGENYRPQKDLRVRIVRPARALHTSLLAGRSGGPHGFFALALTPSRPLRKPVVRLGGAVYDVHVPAGPLHAHQTLTVTGRYRHGGPLPVTLTDGAGGGYATRATVNVGGDPSPNHLAALLWAAREIDRRERAGQKRRAIQLSKRFGLPGRHTSWLAVPRAEMERYRREKDRERMAEVANSLVMLFRAGKEGSPRAQRLRAELQRLGDRSHNAPEDELRDRTYDLAYERAHRFLQEKYHPRPNPRRLRHARKQLDRLAAFLSIPPDSLTGWRETELLRDLLVEEHGREKPDPDRVRRLEQRFISLHTTADSELYARARVERIAVHSELEKIAKRLAEIRSPEGAPALERRRNALGERDDRLRLEIEALEKRQARLATREDELRARTGDPLISVEAPADALRVVALMPDGTLKPLTYRPESGRWEVRFDIPTYAAEGGYTVQVIIVHKDGRRSLARFTFTVDMTAPAAAARLLRPSGETRRIWVEIEAAADTARVAAFLPDREAVPLRRGEGSRYSGWVELPPGFREGDRVKIVITDRAHNRTTLEVDPTTAAAPESATEATR